MPKYKLMNKAVTPSIEVAHKYNVATFDEYKQSGRSVTANYTPLQSLAFSLVYHLHCFGEKPRCFILSHDFVLKLYRSLGGEMISHIENVPITHDEHQLPRITSLG